MRTVGILFLAFFLSALCGCTEREVSVKDRPVRILSERPGIGAPVVPGDLVTINYCATLPGGKVVQEHRDYRFVVGTNTVILGIEEGIRGMRKGGARSVDVPPHKHWGRQGYGEGPGAIPANARLTFHIELTDIN